MILQQRHCGKQLFCFISTLKFDPSKICITVSEEIDHYNEESLRKEKEHLLKEVSPFDVIEYIKNSIEILLNMKDDDIEELREEMNRVRQREKALIKKQKSSEKHL